MVPGGGFERVGCCPCQSRETFLPDAQLLQMAHLADGVLGLSFFAEMAAPRLESRQYGWTLTSWAFQGASKARLQYHAWAQRRSPLLFLLGG